MERQNVFPHTKMSDKPEFELHICPIFSAEHRMQKARLDSEAGGRKIWGRNICNVRYAEDLQLLARK